MPKANFLSYFASEAATISLQIERFFHDKIQKNLIFILSASPRGDAEITQGQAILPLLLPGQVIYRQRGAVRQILLGKNIGNIVFHGSFRDKKLVCYLLV